MPIEWDATTHQYIVKKRAGLSRFAGDYVNWNTKVKQSILPKYMLSPAEAFYSSKLTHDKQNTMRAHHISDNRIQKAVCDYLNRRITYLTLLNSIGTLYQTSWVDVVIAPNLVTIWGQWVKALMLANQSAFYSHFYHSNRQSNAAIATELAQELSSSVANLRIGHKPSDNLLDNAIAPRLNRGIMQSMFSSFFKFLYGQQSSITPTFSFETSASMEVWEHSFTTHKYKIKPKYTQVGGFFVGPDKNTIVISEEAPKSGFKSNSIAEIKIPKRYTLTEGSFLFPHRVTRASLHILPLICISGFLFNKLNDENLGPFVIDNEGDWDQTG